VAVGERAAREIEGLLGLRRGAVRAIPNGVPPAPPGPPPTPRHDGGLVIGSIGRLERQKAYDVLIRALAGLPGARLVLVGDGPERPALERLAGDLGVADRVAVTGWRPDARLSLAGFDVFALPSRWEGLPLVILEAMHAGLPVVATDVGSVAEAVRDGRTGLLVARDDVEGLRGALGRLLGDEPLRHRLGEAGRDLARARFSAPAMAAAYEELYRSVAEGG
jgi:glycosyltransferase involved in cell wall biosynthesis